MKPTTGIIGMAARLPPRAVRSGPVRGPYHQKFSVAATKGMPNEVTLVVYSLS
jgi:hypothetical protein